MFKGFWIEHGEFGKQINPCLRKYWEYCSLFENSWCSPTLKSSAQIYKSLPNMSWTFFNNACHKLFIILLHSNLLQITHWSEKWNIFFVHLALSPFTLHYHCIPHRPLYQCISLASMHILHGRDCLYYQSSAPGCCLQLFNSRVDYVHCVYIIHIEECALTQWLLSQSWMLNIHVLFFDQKSHNPTYT